MEQLHVNTAGQALRLTLDEGRTYFSTAFTDYLLILTRQESAGGLTLAQVPVVASEDSRITVLTVTTLTLLSAGDYQYEVYGQNSASNLDPDNAVGLVEKGWLMLVDNSEAYTVPSVNIPNDIR